MLLILATLCSISIHSLCRYDSKYRGLQYATLVQHLCCSINTCGTTILVLLLLLLAADTVVLHAYADTTVLDGCTVVAYVSASITIAATGVHAISGTVVW